MLIEKYKPKLDNKEFLLFTEELSKHAKVLEDLPLGLLMFVSGRLKELESVDDTNPDKILQEKALYFMAGCLISDKTLSFTDEDVDRLNEVLDGVTTSITLFDLFSKDLLEAEYQRGEWRYRLTEEGVDEVESSVTFK